MRRIIWLLLIISLLSSCSNIFAHKSRTFGTNYNSHKKDKGAFVWKKRVIRNISLSAEMDSSIFSDEKKNRLLFIHKLVEALLNNETDCFQHSDFVYQLNEKEIISDLATIYGWDTTMTFDQLTGIKTIKVPAIKIGNDYKKFSEFKISEEWIYNIKSGVTTIYFTGIAPVMDVYGFSGEYRGTREMFWIKWDKFRRYLTDSIIANSFCDVIMADYFRDSGIVKESVIINKTGYDKNRKENEVIRKIRIAPDTFNTYQDPYLMDQYTTPITEILYKNAYSGQIKTYKNYHLKKGSTLPSDELKRIATSNLECSFPVVDPIIGVEERKIIQKESYFKDIVNYYVAENWHLDLLKGITSIQFTRVAPARDSFSDGKFIGPKPLFWVNYGDARKVLATYNEYNPRYNIEWQVWADRFNEPKRKRPVVE